MDKGQEGLWGGAGGPSFNGSVWKFFMSNRFNWREKQEVEQNVKASVEYSLPGQYENPEEWEKE